MFGFYKSKVAELLEYLELLGNEWQRYLSRLQAHTNSLAYQAPPSRQEQRRRGRPKLIVTRDQLEYLSSLFFSWSDVAKLLGVSRMTVYQRRQELGLLTEPQHTLNDSELSRVLAEMRLRHPYNGESMTFGYLRSRGYHVSRHRIRAQIRATDPINTALRWRGGLTSRRVYSVPGPNSLWHIGLYFECMYDK